MDDFHLRIFQAQLRDQCKFLVFSASALEDGFKNHDSDHVWCSVQNMLTAGANISKLLWGSKGKKAEQRRRLRDSVSVSDHSPLRNVNMRNNFEHMDERIDSWWEESKMHNHADRIIGGRQTIGGIHPRDTFRWLDPESGDLIFWGESFNLRSIISEAARLLPLLQQELNEPTLG